MSQRRHSGETVWLSATMGCIGSHKVQKAKILDTETPWMSCIYECGDPDCVEWVNLQTDQGDYVYHVSECQMHDTEQVAERVTKKRQKR